MFADEAHTWRTKLVVLDHDAV